MTQHTRGHPEYRYFFIGIAYADSACPEALEGRNSGEEKRYSGLPPSTKVQYTLQIDSVLQQSLTLCLSVRYSFAFEPRSRTIFNNFRLVLRCSP